MVEEPIEELEKAAAAGELQAHFRLGWTYARQARKNPRARKSAVRHFEAILEAAASGQPWEGLDTVCFALGALHEEDPESRPLAIAAYRRGLSFNPLSASGHNSLGLLLLRGGQTLGALGEFKLAIQLDPDLPGPYANLARLFSDHLEPGDLAREYQHIVAEFGANGAQVLARLSQELVRVGKEQVSEGFYTWGHRLKNSLGIAGSRLRTLARHAGDSGPARGELLELAADQERLFDEWVGYLDAMKPEQVRPAIVDPVALVREVVEALESRSGRSRLQLRFQRGVPQIEGDGRMLREAILNLCLNALEAVGRAGGEIVLGVGFDEVRRVLFIEVEDDGPGIDGAHLDRLFEPGFTTKERGSGFGLSIARRIAHAHGGDLRVKSRVGHGAVFRLDLPMNFEMGAAGSPGVDYHGSQEKSTG